MLTLLAPAVKKSANPQNLEDCDSETEYISPITTSTPLKSKATTSKNTPITSRNSFSPLKNVQK